MDLKQAELLARAHMNKHSLKDWQLSISYTLKTTFGRCNIETKTIELSALLITLNNPEEVLDTILHEIAHALRESERPQFCGKRTAGMWHDSRWKQIAAALGAEPKQFFNQVGSRQITMKPKTNKEVS